MRGGRAKGVVTDRRLGSLRVGRVRASGGEEVLWDFSAAAASARGRPAPTGCRSASPSRGRTAGRCP